jgi:predicted esterase
MDPEIRHLVVPRTARYLTVGSAADDTSEVWFLCHGYGQLASDLLRQGKALDAPGRLVVAPEALSRFYHEDHEKVGASWMTREDRRIEIEDYVRYLDLLYDTLFAVLDRSRVQVGALGFSQGVATAARWVARGRARIDRLVLWGSALPPELDDDGSLAPLRAVKLTLVSGTRDQFLGEKEWAEQQARLEHHGIEYEKRTFSGGHRLDDDTLRAIADGGSR